MTGPGPPTAPRRSAPIVVAVVAGVLVVVAAVVLPLVLTSDDAGGSRGSRVAGATVDTSNLDLVEEYDVPPWAHVHDDVTYPQSPPVGGDHWDPWLECGVYDVPVLDEYAVHDLEHGSIWLTYRADLVDAAGVAALADQLPSNGIMSPYPDQDAPVVITAWGSQLELIGPNDPRIDLFIDEYGAGATAPEAFSSCAGGTTDPDGPGSAGAAA